MGCRGTVSVVEREPDTTHDVEGSLSPPLSAAARKALLVDRVIIGTIVAAVLVAAYAPAFGWSAHVLWPLLGLGLLAAGVRRSLVPVPFLGGVLPAIRRSEAVRAVLPAWIVSRAGVLLVGLTAVSIVGVDYTHGRFRVSRSEVWNLPARWDAGWYLGIARNGYHWSAHGFDEQQDIAFFPAYPVAMRAVAAVLTLPAHLLDMPELFGGGSARFLWAGALLSIVAFGGALVYIHCLARMDLSAGHATRAVLLLAAYPFAVFFSAPYTEGAFLLATAGSLYYCRRQAYAPAGVLGLCAGLTRPNGFLLSVPLLLEIHDQWSHPRRPRRLGAHLTAACMPVAGMLIYSAFVWRLTGAPFTWMDAQRAWGRSLDVTAFIRHRWDSLQDLGAYVRTEPLDAFAVLGVSIALASMPFLATRFRWSYLAVVGLNLLPPLLLDLPAIGRMTAVLFPVFIWLASATSRPVATALIAGFAVAQAAFAWVFFLWGPLI